MKVVVAGSGVSGLASALVLARADADVTLVDGDPLDATPRWEDAFGWERRGIPHFHQPHAFIPRGRKLLREALPDVYAALIDAGAYERDVTRKLPGGGRVESDDDLVFLVARRELIEWALRDAVRRERRVTVTDRTAVTGLLYAQEPEPRVAGVTTEAGAIEAELVVDAMGRRSRVPHQLEQQLGVSVHADVAPCGYVYYSRFYSMHDGGTFPEGPWLFTPRADLGYVGFIVFDGDNHTFAIVFTVPVEEHGLRLLRDVRAFDAAAAAMPLLAPLVADEFAQPITGVLPMGHLNNTLHHYVAEGRPLVRGLAPVGDALCHTNPAFALGISQSLLHPVALRDALARNRDPDDALVGYFAAVWPDAVERFAWARDVDEAKARIRGGEDLDVGRHDGCYPLFSLVAAGGAATRDEDVFRAFVRRYGFLDRTAVLDEDVDLQRRIERIFAEMRAEAPPPSGISRDELHALVGAATTVPAA